MTALEPRATGVTVDVDDAAATVREVWEAS